MIDDQGVSDDFRALGIFPDSCPLSKVDDWVEANVDNYDFNQLRLARLVSHPDAGGMGTGPGRVGALCFPQTDGPSAPTTDRSFKQEDEESKRW